MSKPIDIQYIRSLAKAISKAPSLDIAKGLAQGLSSYIDSIEPIRISSIGIKGNYIQAIKHIRIALNKGLKEAKELADARGIKEAQDHFDSFIKTNWKHTRQFQIEPVSNFFISDWRLVTDYNSYSSSYDLAEKPKVILRNVPISIDDYKRGKQVTSVKDLIEKFVTETTKQNKR